MLGYLPAQYSVSLCQVLLLVSILFSGYIKVIMPCTVIFKVAGFIVSDIDINPCQ